MTPNTSAAPSTPENPPSMGWNRNSTHSTPKERPARLTSKVRPRKYDDPAYSGGNLERPALKKLLSDIDAGKVDVVVVYKIDRLTRSLADFAKLVEAFDARSISFVAVTQQFNTTTSMGRLTLNVLLSFAQFERELSSERVRDKIAASRRKGKWTGGTVPLGYEARDKKLIINKIEAETVRTIFRLYLELKSFSKLVAELDRRRIVTKRRSTKVAKYSGGIPFTYGPLSYFLRNRIYIGETHHSGKWFEGEHQAIIDRQSFDRVQETLKVNAVRKAKPSPSGALLAGKLFDDKGNRMSASFSSKNGVRYRFYVSTALRGRKDKAGSIARISATEIEGIVENTLRKQLPDQDGSQDTIADCVDRVTVKKNSVEITILPGILSNNLIDIPQTRIVSNGKFVPPTLSDRKADQKLVQSFVRAHRWLTDLSSGRYGSVEDLADAVSLHPKVVRQGLRLAFLSPEVTSAILAGDRPLELKQIPKLLPISWHQQRLILG